MSVFVLLYQKNSDNWEAAYYRQKAENVYLEQAESMYRLTLQRDAHHVLARNNLGLLLFRRRHYAEAEAEYLRALEIDPQHATVLSNLSLLRDTLRRTQLAQLQQPQ